MAKRTATATMTATAATAMTTPALGMPRRQFVRLVVLGAGTAVLPLACGPSPEPDPGTADLVPPLPGYFSFAERRLLGLLADYVLPPDDLPGGEAIGTVPYLEQLLTAFDVDPPRLFAAGPYSDRNPIPASDGQPSDARPANSFLTFLPLTRTQELAWRLELYGSGGVPGGGPNDAALGPVIGLRQVYAEALEQGLGLLGGSLDGVTADDIVGLWPKLGDRFRYDFSIRVIEATVSLPEYGGNIDRAGWQIAHTLGDTMPYGFTPYDTVAGRYRPHPSEPFSERDRRPDPDPIDGDLRLHLELVVAGAGGKKFY